MKLITRDHCVVTGSNDFEFLHELKNFPIFMGCVDSPAAEDVGADMSWSISRGSGLVQLNRLVPLDVLYSESHGSGAIGALWDKHHKAFAHFLNRMTPSAVLEVGGAHGILAREYKQFAKIPWTIVEPNPSPAEGCDARFIKGFFDENFSYDEACDAIVHSHVFEHIYEPDQFMTNLAGFMSEGKHLVFSLPNLEVMLERKYTNCINFEHTVFLTEPYVEFLLAKHGFRLLTKEYFLEDHSIFYAAVRDKSIEPEELSLELYEKNKQLYLEYLNYHEKLIVGLNSVINNSERPIYLFGAHIFSQYLIEFGLETRKIICLLDNDLGKHNKRLYGTNLVVQSPTILKDVDRPLVILKAGVYNTEIKEAILDEINDGTIFIE